MANYLGVGIHENIVLGSETKVNEKGSLVINMAKKVQSNDMFTAFDEGNDVQASAASLILWPIKLTDWENKQKTATQIGQELINFKNILTDILLVFMTTEKANQALNAEVMFKGLGITAETQASLPQKLVQEDFVNAVYANVSNAFVAAATPYIGQTTFRVKLRRTSKAKHFAIIPPKGKYPEPWIEPMTVPAEASKIEWNSYEIEKGLNSGVPQETDPVDKEAQDKVNTAFSAPPVQGGGEVSAPTAPPVPPSEAENPFNQ